MWIAIGGVIGLLGAALLKLMDVVIEGRGSVARRSIRADVELLTGLPKEMQSGPAGNALRRRIEQALLTYGDAMLPDPGSPEASLEPDSSAPGNEENAPDDRWLASLKHEFRREVIRTETSIAIRFSVSAAVLSMGYLAVFGDGGRPDADVNWFAVVTSAALITIPLMASVLLGSRWVALWWVRRRWQRAGTAVSWSWARSAMRRR